MRAPRGHTQRQAAVRRRMDVYLDEDLYDWVHAQATRQGRSMSNWMGWVVTQLREGLTPVAEGGMVGGTHNSEGGESR